MKRETIRRPRMAWRERLLKLVLLGFSLLLVAAMGEVALRLLGHRGAPEALIDNAYLVDDPVLDWRYEPFSEWSEGRVVYRYNSAGFRDIEHEIEKPRGTQRIVVVGDSVTDGAGVQREATFTGVLQSSLAGYEVINLAQSGLNTPQEVHLLERDGLPYAPDLVVINFVLNDCDFFTQLGPARRYYDERDSRIGLLFDMPVDPRFKRALKSSALIYFLKERGEHLKGRLLGVEEDDYFERIWQSEENRAKISSGFEHLAALRAEHGFDVVVIIWPILMPYDDYGYASVHDWVRNEAAERGFAVLDLLPDFEPISYHDLQVTVEDNVHPNDLGHRVAADAFLAWFRSRKPAVEGAGLGRSAAGRSPGS